MITKQDRIFGTILGLACGDALGAPVEFMTQNEVINKYGSDGISELDIAYNIKGAYTDDTQMSLATARGILNAKKIESIVDPIPYIYIEYLKWLQSQQNPKEIRGPGNTCLSALKQGIAGSTSNIINNSKGCGGVMRVAPIGLVYKINDAWRHGIESAALTHSHPGGFLPAGFLAVMLSWILINANEDTPPIICFINSFHTGMEFLKGWPKSDERDHFLNLMVNMKTLSTQTDLDDKVAMYKLGAGWCGDEALAMACLMSFRHISNFRNGVQKAVHFSGDRDSVGSITGALMGCLLGINSIPDSWLSNIENKDLLESTAKQLTELGK